MNLAVVYTRAQCGIDAPLVSVETHLSNGLPGLSIVGLPETEVKESKDRVRAALLNSRFEYPTRRITVNLAPADLPKEGGRFDLAIALGILAASGQLPADSLQEYEFLGELALGGQLRPVRGALPASMHCRRAGRCLVVPADNFGEAALVEGVQVLSAAHLGEVCAHLAGQQRLIPAALSAALDRPVERQPDLSEVRGQHQAKRALEIAAAGGHSLLMIGPPGTGKSMLARRLPGILPGMTQEEAIESAAVQSISHQGFDAGQWKIRPFRAPHHTASAVALVGGGSHPRPGEISLAHHGVMFLDELPEFDRRVLEVLREPLETGVITISRATRQADFPARFQFIAAMNPCPCGYYGDTSGRCRCTPDQVARYRGKLSGPLLDRIDMHVEVPGIPMELLQEPAAGSEENSQTVRVRVEAARALQLRRSGQANARLDNSQLDEACRLDNAPAMFLRAAIARLGLSARAYHRVLKLARTIADLAGEESIATAHISEAIAYRRLDRSLPERHDSLLQS
ncbi:MAG: YifB family Mg chelatase-like AAA ATPase [Thiohalophilus sp.]|jgi:magnesium chelatase family protein